LLGCSPTSQTGSSLADCSSASTDGELSQVATHPDGTKKSEVILKKEVIDGEAKGVFVFRNWRRNGKRLSEQTLIDGKSHGVRKKWYDNGQLEWEQECKNGVLHGAHTSWYQNGAKREQGFYRNGKRDGHWQFWDVCGQNWEESEYQEGRLIKSMQNKGKGRVQKYAYDEASDQTTFVIQSDRNGVLYKKTFPGYVTIQHCINAYYEDASAPIAQNGKDSTPQPTPAPSQRKRTGQNDTIAEGNDDRER